MNKNYLNLKLKQEKRNWKDILNIKTNKKKQKELILFIAEKMIRKPNFGKTVLAKMMYFSETNLFLKTGNTIAGTIFIKKDYGPLPKDFDNILNEMANQKLIQLVKIEGKNHDLINIMPLREPNTEIFTNDEMDIIEDVIGRLNEFSARLIRDYSHRDVAWKWTKYGEEIDYRLTGYRDIQVM